MGAEMKNGTGSAAKAVNRVTIIGLGLIGGSLARALREKTAIADIIAVNRTEKPLLDAKADGAISEGYRDICGEALASDIIFICTPVKTAVEYIGRISGKVGGDCIVTDICSTKSEIMRAAERMDDPSCFIGGHPMAGTEKSGYMSSFAHMFENAYYILSPAPGTPGSKVDTLAGLIREIGGIPVVINAGEHDRITGCISHLPHIIASALVNMVRQSDDRNGMMRMLAAGGFRDITRIASSSPEMWENIVMSNRENILGLLNGYKGMLERFENLMTANDPESVKDFFISARDYRNSFEARKKGSIEPSFDITVDVPDKPGIIGNIATMLGNRGINIKNINVSNSREHEQGCLIITLPDAWSEDAAYELLASGGYRVFKNK